MEKTNGSAKAFEPRVHPAKGTSTDGFWTKASNSLVVKGASLSEVTIAQRKIGSATISFFAKPYGKTKNPSVLARVRKAVKKKKTDAPGKTVVINLDMPGFQRLESVLAIFPVSRAAWYAGIAEGRYPAGIQIGKRSVAWSNASLKALIADVSNQEGDTFDTS